MLTNKLTIAVKALIELKMNSNCKLKEEIVEDLVSKRDNKDL
jgi:hypothetical protein